MTDMSSSQYVSADGTPLRGDGTPFPDDQSQWSAEESQYLQDHWFGVTDGDSQVNAEEVATDDVPEIHDDGQAMA